MKRNPLRAFEISCGLREGYDLNAPVHTARDARNVIQAWLQKRTSEKKAVAVGALFTGEFIYPWEEGGEISSRFEDAILYKGRIREDASDEHAIELLSDLATALKIALNQERVHVVFANQHWVV